eukprot:Tbor_TRINITY_DN3619_c0_g1::TRINITY_DN3619_c0_g1_i1::g.210::m.210
MSLFILWLAICTGLVTTGSGIVHQNNYAAQEDERLLFNSDELFLTIPDITGVAILDIKSADFDAQSFIYGVRKMYNLNIAKNMVIIEACGVDQTKKTATSFTDIQCVNQTDPYYPAILVRWTDITFKSDLGQIVLSTHLQLDNVSDVWTYLSKNTSIRCIGVGVYKPFTRVGKIEETIERIQSAGSFFAIFGVIIFMITMSLLMILLYLCYRCCCSKSHKEINGDSFIVESNRDANYDEENNDYLEQNNHPTQTIHRQPGSNVDESYRGEEMHSVRE